MSKQVPIEFAELQLCQYVYHCPPSVLAEQPADRVYLDMWMLGIVESAKPKPKTPRGGRRR